MIDMTKYGFRSARAFRRAKNVSLDTFEAVAIDKWWKIAKQVLLHPECPMHIRERFRNSTIWYERFVAIYASCAPAGYLAHAKNDLDRTIRGRYEGTVRYRAIAPLERLLKKLNIPKEKS